MKNIAKKRIVIIILEICCLCSVYMCIYEYHAADQNKSYSAQQSFPVITGEDVRKIFNEDKRDYDLVFWKEDMNRMITNPVLKKTKEVTVIQAYGNIKILFPDASYLYTGDLQGCVIDKTTAFELFGTINIDNVEIIYDNKSYYIRDTFDAKIPICIFENNSKDAEFDTITFSKPVSTDMFNTSYGMNLKYIERDLIIEILRASLIILILFLLVEISIKTGIFTKIKKDDKGNIKYTIACVVIIGGIVLFFYYINTTLEELPTKWSDFSFWREYSEKKKDQFDYQMRVPVKATEIQFAYFVFKFIIFYIISWITNTFIVMMKIPGRSR